jgi:REP element-mobilizing transposase RayT
MQPKGWHSRGYLPHFDSPETIQFVTFRLADSLPAHVTDALRDRDQAFPRLDRQLDSGLGACWLKRPDIASMVEDALLHFDGKRYRLLAWCLMPNHAHVVIEIVTENSLSEIVGSWKSFTAKQANKIIKRSGAFWHADYFDRYMRDEDHLGQTIEYVESNPVKAGLVALAAEWQWSSARFSKT